MGLKVVTIGALEFFPALESLADNAPAVFVKPSPSTTLERITTGQTLPDSLRVQVGIR